MPEESELTVEVVYATPDQQTVVTVRLAPGATVADAIERSELAARMPHVDFCNAPVGVFGRTVAREDLVRDGDRVEIYRPLIADPKQSRRLRAVRQR